MKKKDAKVIVVGAGPGGLASAMLLASKGVEVTVYEKNSVIGGRSAEVRLGDYRFDLGPTFLMMKYLMDELFEAAGRRSQDYLNCQRMDPMYKLQFGKKSLLVFGDREKMKAQIEAAFPGESKGLDAFYERESLRFKHLYPCLQKTYGTLDAFLSLKLMRAIPHLAVGRSLYDVLSDYFESEELRLTFTFQSKYLGMSPWDCPGLFAMIPYTEHAHGVFHVVGGLSEISRAFARVAQEYGAKIHTSTPVKQILVRDGKAYGVLFEDGSEALADEIVVNADFGHAVKTLFPPEAMKKWTPKRLEQLKFSCSTFMLYLGLDKIYDCEHHTIFFANDYKQNLKDISDHFKMSDDFSVYIRNASLTDTTLAPPGHSALYVLAPMPNNRSGIDWELEKPKFRDKLIQFLETKTPYKGISAHIKKELVISPNDWENKQSVYIGATFNLGHQIEQLLYFRPHNEFEEFKNCFLVGGGTHPGSGLPTIFESARIAAHLIFKKHGVPVQKPISFDQMMATVEQMG